MSSPGCRALRAESFVAQRCGASGSWLRNTEADFAAILRRTLEYRSRPSLSIAVHGNTVTGCTSCIILQTHVFMPFFRPTDDTTCAGWWIPRKFQQPTRRFRHLGQRLDRHHGPLSTTIGLPSESNGLRICVVVERRMKQEMREVAWIG